MSHYPVFLNVAGRHCVVIGGGEIATRKVSGLLDAGAQVTVVSPHLTATLATYVADGRILHHARAYRDGDVSDFFLAYAATNDDTVHARVAREAATAGVLLNVVDRPHLCNFIVPAVLHRGALQIAVSTGGNSPALAGRVRDDVDAALGDEYERALCVLARLRQRLREGGTASEDRQRVLTGLVHSDLLDCLRRGDDAAVDRLLVQFAGDDVTLASLGVVLSEAEFPANGSAREP